MLNWKWYAGRDNEIFTDGPFDTRDEAVHVAREEMEGGFIMEACKEPLPLAAQFDTHRFLEDAEENNFDLGNENGDPMFDLTPDQIKSLEDCVKSAISLWQASSGLTFTPWAFNRIRNEEYINGQ